jgi:hypothetical protein
MRNFYVSICLFFLSLFILVLPGLTLAQTIAFDNAEDGAYSGDQWRNESNGGTGFGKWQLIPAVDSTGFFIGNPVNDGMGTDGIGTKAFGMYATGTKYANARRSFNAGLQIGDEVSFYWAMNWDANMGTKGFDFIAGTSTVFNVNNGNFSPALITSSGDSALKRYGTKPILVKMKRAGIDLYEFSMTGRDGSETYATTFNSELIIDGLDFYIGYQIDTNPLNPDDQRTDGRRNVYFNNFKITSTTSDVSNLKFEKGFRVYPNPVGRGGVMQFAIVNLTAGKYTVNVYNLAGVRIQQEVFIHKGGKGLQSVTLSDGLAPGVYIAEVLGAGKRENLKLVVE